MERWRWFGDGAMGMWVLETHFNRIGARVGEVFVGYGCEGGDCDWCVGGARHR